MRVHGDVKPPEISAGSMPDKPGRAWVRMTSNARQETDEEGRTSWVYDEYTAEVADTPGLLDEAKANYDSLLREAKAAEKSKADLVEENEKLEAENKLLKAQVELQSQQQTMLEGCLLEMADIVYA